MKKILLALLVLPCSCGMFSQRMDTSVHSVLFLGNSITYAGSYISAIETSFKLAHPSQAITFINLGLPSETVSGLSEDGHAGGRFPRPDLHERLHRILSIVHADLVFACYGMNDGIYLPFDDSRFKKFQQGLTWLHDTITSTGVKIVMVTPPVYDELRAGAAGYALVLDKYASWILTQQKAAQWKVADIHFPMKRYLEAHRRVDKAAGVDGFSLATDGVHPGEAGHWLIAKQLLLYLGERQSASFASLVDLQRHYKNGAAVATLVSSRQQMMKDAWLTATGHRRPEMTTGLPLEEAKAKSLVIEQAIKQLLQP